MDSQIFDSDNSNSSSFASSSSEEDGQVLWIGFLAAGISVIGFGSNFVPVKKIYSGDGIFFQFVVQIHHTPDTTSTTERKKEPKKKGQKSSSKKTP